MDEHKFTAEFLETQQKEFSTFTHTVEQSEVCPSLNGEKLIIRI